MTFLSICSGIEAATVAWTPLRWRCLAVAEIDKFCCALLNHYYPKVPNLGDINEFKKWPDSRVGVLVGGTPCQDFSVAGQRAGMDGDRGQLTLRFLDIVGRYSPAWIVWENVPGVLSSDGRRAFGAFLGRLAKLGYGFAYRVLDAQYAGLAQRRERVFVVGCTRGQWQRAAAVLFDAPRLCWNPAPSREAGKRIAPTVESRASAGGAGWGTDFLADGGLVAAFGGNNTSGPIQVAATPNGCKTASGRQDFETETFVTVAAIDANYGKLQGASGQDARHGHSHLVAFSCKDNCRDIQSDLAPTMNHSKSHANGGGQVAIAFTERTRADGRSLETQADLAYAVTNPGSGGRTQERQLYDGCGVRRLTPVEVERLFGFPDNYTRIPWRGKPAESCPDSPRYRALGNSIAVPVLRWIGRRIEMVEGL